MDINLFTTYYIVFSDCLIYGMIILQSINWSFLTDQPCPPPPELKFWSFQFLFNLISRGSHLIMQILILFTLDGKKIQNILDKKTPPKMLSRNIRASQIQNCSVIFKPFIKVPRQYSEVPKNMYVFLWF